MSDENNENNETPVTTKPLFGTRQESKPLHDLGSNLDQDPEFREAAGMEPLPETVSPSEGEVQPTVIENEVDNIQMDQMNEAAEAVATEATIETPVEGTADNTVGVVDGAPVDGSQADLVADVSVALQDQVAGSDVAPETVLEEAPAAVSTEVAAAAAADNAASSLQVGSDDGETIETLRAKQDALNRQLAEKTKAEQTAVMDQIKNVVNTYNIDVAALVEHLGGLKSKRVGSKAKAKYRDPATGKEWSGRGKEPLWIKGRDRNQFAITE